MIKIRLYLEPLVTKGRENTTHQRRIVFSYLQNKEAVKELFGPIAEKVGERPGGYLRVIKLGFRHGDGAETAMIEFVDFNETYNPNAGKVKQAKKTRRGGAKKAADVAAVAAPVVEEVAVAEEIAAPVEEVVEAPVAEVEAAAEVAETAVEEVAETVEAASEEVAEVAETVEAAAEEAVAEATEEAAPAEEEKKDEEAA